jgi:pimeloyl-ACP methyl ester carboxylesterase
MLQVASKPRAERPEQTRARRPDASGVVDSAGVPIAWEVYGAAEPAIVLVPSWSVVHSRLWKMQIPALARHHKVLTFDPRGNGRSGRPTTQEAYDERAFAADIEAVMAATNTPRAVLISLSRGAQRALIMAAEHPERVRGAIFIAPSLRLASPHPYRAAVPFEEPLSSDEGWSKYNLHYWRRAYADFLEFFFGQCFSEPHSTKPIEDCLAWGDEIGAQALILSALAPGIGTRQDVLEMAADVRCPVLVIHGDDDHVVPHAVGAELARATAGRLVTIVGGGHIPNVRHPVKINLLLREFIRSLPLEAGGARDSA